jgi:hypothetical protein
MKEDETLETVAMMAAIIWAGRQYPAYRENVGTYPSDVAGEAWQLFDAVRQADPRSVEPVLTP